MKKIITLLLITNLLILGACNYSTGFKKELHGLSFNYNGFRVNDVLLVGPGNTVIDKNKVQFNTQIAIVVLGIENYGLKEGKVFPGMMIVITDKYGFAVINGADLFAGNAGYPPMNATELRGNITIAQPMKTGETYHVKMRVWDKVNPENEINAETDITIR